MGAPSASTSLQRKGDFRSEVSESRVNLKHNALSDASRILKILDFYDLSNCRSCKAKARRVTVFATPDVCKLMWNCWIKKKEVKV